MSIFIILIILVFSAVVHEVMHGVVAGWFGDDTAKHEGRITLNPLPHLDLFGSVALPLLLLAVGSPVILGAAKPVPVDFSRLKPFRLGMALVALAGPLANFVMAVVGAVFLKLSLTGDFGASILLQFVAINLVLGVFNLLPIPPLDGSKVLAALGSREWMTTLLSMERFGFLLVLLFLLLGILDKILLPVLSGFFDLFGLG